MKCIDYAADWYKMEAGERLEPPPCKPQPMLQGAMVMTAFLPIALTDRFQDITGQRYGILIVVRPFGYTRQPCGKRLLHWLVRCNCGNEKTALRANLDAGRTNSCGCREGGYRHGKIHVPEYNRWKAMRSRCTYRKAECYPNYGGRGIKVCERWNGPNGFANFLADMGAMPSCKHTLDRINNDGDYCPENCRWTTYKDQRRNTRTNRLVTYSGETKTLAEWIEILRLNGRLIRTRIERGWPSEEAFNTPSGCRLSPLQRRIRATA